MAKRKAPAAQLGDAPIEARFRQTMNVVAGAIDEVFNGPRPIVERKVGFVLLVFPYGEAEGRCNYISNGAGRKEIAILFREQARRFEGAPEPGVGHG
jgi:hypothetical protein